MLQLAFRFLAGGAIVSLFAVIGDVLKPKSFAGLFGAAPSVALATLGLTAVTEGAAYAGLESRSMIAGATAFLLYAFLCCRVLMKYKYRAATVTVALLAFWLAFSFAVWFWILR